MVFPLHLAVPGPIDQRTGGYIYDRRIVDQLIERDWSIEVHELAGRFPDADETAIEAAATAVSAVGDGLFIIDGLALLAFADQMDRLEGRWVGLIHHPLSMETGVSGEEALRIARLEGDLMRRAAKLIVTSPGTRRDLERFDLDPADIAVVTPGVDPAPLAAGSGLDRPNALLTVGSLTKRKGHLVLLDALARLIDLDWHLSLVGSAAWDPEHAAAIRRAIDELGLEDRVDQVGEQDEAGLADLYDRADLFVLASHHEGYGMVLTEALARGLPIISTTAGAIPETVPDGAGRLVPPGDAEAMAAALRDVLTEPDAYRRLQKGALEARGKLRTWKDQAGALAEVLEQVDIP
jgi:glycosyltransferase involved in cell wall biosynthesis